MSNRLKEIIIVKGILKNISPFIIGKGRGDIRDIEILKDEDNKPYIPATSFVGALKNYFYETYPERLHYDYFWGSQDMQSHFIVNDLKLINNDYLFSFRDGIAIDNTKGITREKAKFDYEIVENECNFSLNAEIKIMEKIDSNCIFEILKACIDELKDSKIQLGAMTTKGFGKFRLENEKIYRFVFPNDGVEYIEAVENQFRDCKIFDLSNITSPQKLPSSDLIVEANFQIKNALIVSTHSSNPDEPDRVHIRSNGKAVIPGTSLKGSLRARAEKIINTLNGNGDELLKKTFGWADPEGKSKIKYRSRIFVEESIIENEYEDLQTRIKIDRFTGGAMYGALMETKPLWHKDENIKIKIIVRNFEPWEAGLILLLLKDLWTSDLPIGGEKSIGRGVLKGKDASIKFNGNEIKIINENGKLKIIGDKNILEDL